MAKPSLRRAGDFPRQLRHIECFRATHNIIKLKAIGYNHSIGKFRIDNQSSPTSSLIP
tara:strand:- start:223 stop:396 length:174 start_codon:yes stop_codon:yes gene_type:complete